MTEPTHFTRIKERKLFQWAAAYLAGAFVVLQALDPLSQAWAISERIQQAIQIVLLVGLVVTLVLAWYHGEKGHQRIGGTEVLILACVLVLAGWALSLLPGPGDGPAVLGIEKSPSQDLDRPAIAVLPLDNFSPSPDDAYFADGMEAEIVSKLSRISGLRVISRSSMEQYRGAHPEIPQVAADLGVGFVLEGSARLSGGQVRLLVQLFRGPAEEQVWSGEYTRSFSTENLLAVQVEIADQIARSMSVAVKPEERSRIEATPTTDAEAYKYYLRAKSQVGSTEPDVQTRIRLYERAVELDPGFSLAFAGLSRAHARMWWYHWDRNPERVEEARSALGRATELDPDLAEVLLAEGYFYYYALLDYDRSIEKLSMALERQPGNSDIVAAMGFVRRRQGRFEEAVDLLDRALRDDPVSHAYAQNLGGTLFYMRRYEEGKTILERARLLGPGQPAPHYYLVLLPIAWYGGLAEGWEAIEAARSMGAEDARLAFTRVWLEILGRDFLAAERRLLNTPWDANDNQNEYIPKALRLAQIAGLQGDRRREQAYYDSARVVMESMVETHPGDSRLRSSLGVAYAGLGLVDVAIREGELGVELMPISREALRGAHRAWDLALVHLMVGNSDKAVDQIDQLLSVPGHLSVPILQIDPIWDPLRSHPRFQALLGEYRDDVEH